MFSKLSNMLTELENTKGSKLKGVLLQKLVADSDFQWLCQAALDAGFSYGIKVFPAFVQGKPGDVIAGGSMVGHIQNHLEKMKEDSGVSDQDLYEVWKLACISPEHYNVITRILRKDLRCGCGCDSINKASLKTLGFRLVYRAPYQRCGQSNKIETVRFPAQLERKANGMFVYGHEEGYFTTRQGHQFSIADNPVTEQHGTTPALAGKVLIQELVVLDSEGKVMSRAIGNGIINSFIKGEGDTEHVPNIRAFSWGMITNEEFEAWESKTPYRVMFPLLVEALGTGGAIQPIEHWEVKNMAEAQAKANELIGQGEEGGVLKNILDDNFCWRDEDPCNYQFKMKAEAEADFEIVDAYPGDAGKKYEHMLGGITVKTCDGLLVSDCGGGFPDKLRELGVMFWKKQAGRIVTLKFNGVTSKEGSDIKALDHPRIVSEIRLDKTKADTLEYCQEALLGKTAE